MTGTVAGWYPDPTGRFELRYWDGRFWTPRVVSGSETTIDLATEAVASAERAQVRAYVDGAFDRGVLDATMHDRLLADLLAAPLVPPPPARTARTERPGLLEVIGVRPPPPTPTRAPPPTTTLTPPPVASLPPPPPPPSARSLQPPPPWMTTSPPVARTAFPPAPPVPPTPRPPRPPREPSNGWWARTWRTISADLAIGGLAYLGVLLVFAGVFGFLVFAFGDVDPALRPVAELALPATFFGAGWFLRRRGAPFVGDTLQFLGGALLPVVAIAALTDGTAPDAVGSALVVALTAICLALSAAYAGLSLRRADSPLRFLIAPLAWLAVAAAGLGLGGEIPSGREVVTPNPMQWALVTAAVAATIAAARWRPSHPIAHAALVASTAGLPLAYVVTLLAAPSAGWPVGALVVAGAATVIGLDLLHTRLGDTVTGVLQLAVLGVTAAALAPELGAGWAAAVSGLAMLALAERTDRVRPGIATGFALGGTALAVWVATAAAAVDPWAVVVLSVPATVWALIRNLRPLRSDVAALVPEVALYALPVTATIGLATAVGIPEALASVAVVPLLAAVALRRTSARSDPVLAAWAPAAAAAVVAATWWAAGEDPALGGSAGWLLAVAAGLAAVTLAVTPRWPELRTWATAVAAATSFAFATNGAELSLTVTGALAASAGAVLVLVAAVPASRSTPTSRRAILGHVGVIGHLATLVGLIVALTASPAGAALPWATVAALAAWALGWVVTTVAAETSGSPVTDLMWRVAANPALDEIGEGPRPASELQRASATLAPALALASLTALVAAAVHTWGGLADVWIPIPALVVPIVGALLGRRVGTTRRHLGWAMAHVGSLAILVLALASLATPATAVVGGLGVIAFVVAEEPRRRTHPVLALAWLASLWVTVAGLEILDLPDDLAGVDVLTWGSIALIGSLAVDMVLHGPRLPGGPLTRDRRLAAAVPLASIALAVGLGVVLDSTTAVAGRWWLLVAVVVAVAAAQLRLGVITTVSWSLATVSYALLSPWPPDDHLWTWLPWTAALLAAAALAHERTPAGTDWRRRWDLPPFLLAHASAGLGLLVSSGSTAADASLTWLGTGALSFGVAARLRRAPWVAGGIWLTLTGAALAGSGWLTLALALTTVAATVAASQTRDRTRTMVQLGALASAAATWGSTANWQTWDAEQYAIATAVAAGTLALGLALAARFTTLGRDWLVSWGALAVTGTASAAVALAAVVLEPATTGAEAWAALAETPATAWLALGVAMVALATGLAAAPTGTPWLRHLPAPLATAAAVLLVAATAATATATVAVAALVGAAATVVVVGAWSEDRESPWLPPTTELGGLALGVAATAAGTALPDTGLLVAVLLLAGIEALALGTVGHRIGFLVASPLLVCAAWLTYAAGALTGDPQWFTVPVALALLTVVELVRHERRRTGQPVATGELEALDVIGMIVLVSPSLVETATESILFGLLGAALGAGLLVWGALTRVRRRAAVGAATVATSLALMVLVPLLGNLPAVGGPAVWLGLATLGLVALVVAAFLEKGRETARAVVARARELTKGWE